MSASYFNRKPYIPVTLSELNDLLGSMILFAPTFVDPGGDFPEQNIDTRFHQLFEGAAVVRKKLGEERYASLIDLATRAKQLFADDQDDTNGKTDQGRALLFEIEDLLSDARRARVKARLADDDGEVSGD
jgi:hypothetical protein